MLPVKIQGLMRSGRCCSSERKISESVEAAMARLPHTLSPADQRTIVKATRMPHKVAQMVERKAIIQSEL
jgi:hypothetical protein